MATLNFITSTLQQTVNNDQNLFNIFNGVIHPEIERLHVDDTCVFIDIISTPFGTDINFHDGGATFNEATKEMDYTYYSQIKCTIPYERSIKLYFSIEEGIICYLGER